MASYSGKGAPSNGSTVYVSNLPRRTDDDMLAEYFGTIGLIKKDKRTGRPKIWLYRDKVTNEPKGDATVTFEDPFAALAAVEWFNEKDFHGATIGVCIAESKKDDNLYNSGILAEELSLGGDLTALDDSVNDTNGGAGSGRGHGDVPSGKAWQQDGDWTCPNTRGGHAGGYKELDEEEIEETRRRRREAEEDDGEMYDEFGNLKKKFRAKMQQAEAGQVLSGAERAGWEVEELGKSDMDRRERSRGKGRERGERGHSKTRERERSRDRRRSRSLRQGQGPRPRPRLRL